MKTVKKNVFQVRYRMGGCEEYKLVEADYFTEAVDIISSYYENSSNFKILGIETSMPIIRALTKTITVEL